MEKIFLQSSLKKKTSNRFIQNFVNTCCSEIKDALSLFWENIFIFDGNSNYYSEIDFKSLATCGYWNYSMSIIENKEIDDFSEIKFSLESK